MKNEWWADCRKEKGLSRMLNERMGIKEKKNGRRKKGKERWWY